MYLNKKRPRPYYEKGSRWKEVTWTPTSQNSSRPYDTQDSITTILWSSTNSPTDSQSRCMKTSIPTNSPVHTNNGGKKLSNNRKPSYTSERDSTVGAPHLRRPQGQYSIINGGELPETLTQWTPLKEG